ncbi:MAG: UDP-N-acetylmuramoyl-L-alanyl-D-glutamate--2,6-diaminopimelate ligase [Actinobacteria bacterium]|nr:UDP-N-acetylmuramoyl-L-alanyl-D-glutamate--2,6-diaminopimelate ligase [Actinomycetota bacterium]
MSDNRPPAKLLGRLAGAAADLLVSVDEDSETTARGLAYDSRRVNPGDLFCCVAGAQSDGHVHAPSAVAAGATALLVERRLDLGVPEVVVVDARRAMARLAAEFWDHPARSFKLVGVTGTNGKTTTAYLVDSIMQAAGHPTGLIGTIETRVGGRVRPGVRTTPESVDLQSLFAEMRNDHVGAVAMEVTSHALVLNRVEGVRFDAAVFTNLSQDHLDFHRDMEDYFAAKSGLFRPDRSVKGAANIDDVYGQKLLADAQIPLLSFGTAREADVRARNVKVGQHDTEFTIEVHVDGRIEAEGRIRTHLVGAFNVSNCLAAAAAALQAGIGWEAISDGLGALRAVPGRFESIDQGQSFSVIVDYAHTPDSLDNILREARRMAGRHGGRVVCVFGCGGDRDAGKRPLMGGAAARLADVVIVTSDNPRSEDPRSIIGQILEGVLVERTEGPDAVIEDRATAIRVALGRARSGDVVVIAGRGHETLQERADGVIPLDDRKVARAALTDLGLGERP